MVERAFLPQKPSYYKSYLGVNLILMLNYRLSFDVEAKNSNKEIQVLIFSRKVVPAWKENNNRQALKLPIL
ncbi:MAG: hypothetical protein WB988_01140 [Candidatus Nitrosopolaris sp.]